MFIGTIIVLMGVLFLLQNLHIITGDFWEVIWPLFIVAAGLSMIFRHKKEGCNTKQD